MTFTLYVDGEGTPEVPTYFSYTAMLNNKPMRSIQISRFYLKNLTPKMLPDHCSIFDNRGLSTNIIAEYCSVYYGLLKFKEYYDWSTVTIYHDSEVVIKHMSALQFSFVSRFAKLLGKYSNCCC